MTRRLRALLALLLAVLPVSIALAVGGSPAHALTDRWAAWEPVAGSANDLTTTMRQRSPGFPEASVASDSRSNVQLPAGTATFLGAGTPPGQKYGSSQGSRYLVLRPRADTPTTPSTTTYTFEHPTPDTGWAFVLGDVDADQVRVRARDEDGEPVPAAEVDSWFAGTFNYAGGSDEPSWVSATSTLRGNAAADDTDGASGWFEPDVRLTSLTLVFTRRAGFPVYQTWFVSRARPLGGTVDDLTTGGGTCPVEDSVLTLVSPFGEELATTSPEPDGSYSFGEHATQAGYVVRLRAPGACAVLGAAEQTASNRGNDDDPASRADFDVRRVVPQPISGTVRDGAREPVAGVEVTLTRPDGSTATTTTGPDGGYLFDDNDEGPGYRVDVVVPPGYGPGPDGTRIDDIEVDDTPITEQDFVVVALPSVSGTVTGGGHPLGGVRVVLTPDGGGPALSAVTRGDGTYDLTGVPPGDYTLSVDAPDGYDAPPGRPLTVAGADLVDQDVALTRPGAAGGQVTDADSGEPVAGVQVVVDGPGAPVTVATDDEGRWFVDGLDAGDYTVTVTPPEGTEVVGGATASITITGAGEVRAGVDFEVRAVDEPTQTPTATPTESPTTATPTPTAEPTEGPGTDTDGDGDGLPDTGGPPLGLLVGGVLLVVAGVALTATAGARRRE